MDPKSEGTPCPPCPILPKTHLEGQPARDALARASYGIILATFYRLYAHVRSQRHLTGFRVSTFRV